MRLPTLIVAMTAMLLLVGAQTPTQPAPQQPAPQTPAPAPTQNPQTPAAPTQTPAQPPAGTVAPQPVPPPTETAQPAPAPPRGRFVYAIDASHGGDDPGATLSDKLKEKDVALALARRIRTELSNRGATVMMVRDADASLASDQRAQTVNAWRPAIYLAVHVSTMGSGVRLYTPLLPEVPAPPGSWQAWDRAQQNWLDASQAAAESMASDLGEKQFGATVLAAPLRPLNSISATAVALELAPPPGGKATADMLVSTQYQQRVAVAVASALLAAHGKAGERP